MHRTRNVIVALIAAAVLATAAGGAVAAHDGRGGRGGDPAHTARPVGTIKPLKTVVPKGTGEHFTCNPAATPSPTAVPTANSSTGAVTAFNRFGVARNVQSWTIVFRNNFNAEFCSVKNLQKSADGRIGSLVKQLQYLNVLVGKSSLSAGDQATLSGEIGSAVSDLQALKAKIDAETTVAGVQADMVTLSQESKLAKGIQTQVQGILGALMVMSKDATFETLAATLQGKIDAAASGIDTAAAQKYLDDLKAKAADAGSLVGPLPAQLLALTTAQLQAGKADPTLAGAFRSLRKASWDLWMARHDAWVVQWILNGKPGFHGKPSPSPSASPVITPAPTIAPTQAPTEAPTIAPTEAPTVSPTV